jgi:hypothetical protein
VAGNISESEVPHDVGLEQQDACLAMPGRSLATGINEAVSARQEASHDVGRHRQDPVRLQDLEVVGNRGTACLPRSGAYQCETPRTLSDAFAAPRAMHSPWYSRHASGIRGHQLPRWAQLSPKPSFMVWVMVTTNHLPSLKWTDRNCDTPRLTFELHSRRSG